MGLTLLSHIPAECGKHSTILVHTGGILWRHAILSNVLFLTSRSHFQVDHGEEGEEEGEEWEEEREAEGAIDVTQRSYPCIPVGSEF